MNSHIDGAEAASLAADCLIGCGYRTVEAEATAQALLEASLRGIDTHGIAQMLPHHAGEAITGVVVPTANPSIVHDTPAMVMIDGHHAPGVASLQLGIDDVKRRVTRTGAVVTVIRNCGYIGALGVAVLPLIESGLLAVMMMNGEPTVAPHGGTTALHGTSPIAFGSPGPDGPIIFDTRTNALRKADAWNASVAGAELPDHSAVLPDGTALRNPRDLDFGALLPLAGPKGFGLALMVDLLSAGLAGGPVGREVGQGPTQTSLFLLTITPESTGHHHYQDVTRRLVNQVRDTPPLPTFDEVRMPGQRANAERKRRLREGLPADQRWERLPDRLADLGLGQDAEAFRRLLDGSTR